MKIKKPTGLNTHTLKKNVQIILLMQRDHFLPGHKKVEIFLCVCIQHLEKSEIFKVTCLYQSSQKSLQFF